MAVKFIPAPDGAFSYVSQYDDEIDQEAVVARVVAELLEGKKDHGLSRGDLLQLGRMRYIETRDETWCCLRNAGAATRFSLMPLSATKKAEVDGEVNAEKRALLAFSLSCVSCANATDKKGETITIERHADRVTRECTDRVGERLAKECGWVALMISRLSERFQAGAA